MKKADVERFIASLENALKEQRYTSQITFPEDRTNECRVWSDVENNGTYSEEFYVALNEWCKLHLGYHARTAYERFKFGNSSDMDKFLEWMGYNEF